MQGDSEYSSGMSDGPFRPFPSGGIFSSSENVIRGICNIFKLLWTDLFALPPCFCFVPPNVYDGHPFQRAIFNPLASGFAFCWSEAPSSPDKLGNWFLAPKLLVNVIRLAKKVIDMHSLCSFRGEAVARLLHWGNPATLSLDTGTHRMLQLWGPVPALWWPPWSYYTWIFVFLLDSINSVF